jgi:hypothetical protein
MSYAQFSGRFEVLVEVVTPDYKYWNRLKGSEGRRTFATRQEAEQAIEDEIASWPNWSEGRKHSFRSRCRIKESTRED